MYKRTTQTKIEKFIGEADSVSTTVNNRFGEYSAVVWKDNQPYEVACETYEGAPAVIRSITPAQAQELTGAWQFNEAELPR